MRIKKMATNLLMITALIFATVGCNGQAGEMDTNSESDDFTVEAEKVVSGTGIGWGIAFLPDGDMLVTEKSGTLFRISDGEIVAEITEGIPSDLDVNGQGGFLDIELHPDYENNGWIYFSYSSSAGEGDGSNTAIMRAQLSDDALTDSEVLYKATPNSSRGQHYGSRIVFDNDGYLFFSIGDRGNRDVLPQGMALNPQSGMIWANEHGPRGGDEVNIVEPGNNYGWPVISYGINYNGTEFAEDTARAGMEQPILYWDPSIAPAGMTFVTSDMYPGWEGDLLVASLKFSYIAHLEVDGDEILEETRLVEGIGRIRAVEEGPDGYIYFTAEGDGVYRLVPSTEE